jgi:uncharacterized protein
MKTRIAVLGGGITGLAAAHCLDSEHLDVTLLERRPVLGGNAHNEFVTHGNQLVPVDDAVDVFWPQRYPFFTGWLRRLGVEAERMDFSQTLWDLHRGDQVRIFSQTSARFTSRRMLEYVTRLRLVLQAISRADIDPTWTMRQFLDTIPGLTQDFVTDFFYPIIGHPYYPPDICSEDEYPARMICSSLNDYIRNQHSILQIKGGVKRYVDLAQATLRHVQISTSKDITRIRRDSDSSEWILTDGTGQEQRFDKVVFTCPPNNLATMLREARPEIAELARGIPVIPATCIVHSDPSLMPRDRSYWSFYNYLVHPRMLKPIGTMWSGKKYGRTPIFTTIDFGDTLIEPKLVKDVHAVNRYTAVPCTFELLACRDKLLREHQGRDGLYFAGAWAVDTPSHEHGLEAALNVVRFIYPESERLAQMDRGAEQIRAEVAEAEQRFQASAAERFLRRFGDPIARRLLSPSPDPIARRLLSPSPARV